MIEHVPAAALLAALIADWQFGEPPNRLHPVVAMGNWIGLTRRQGFKFRSNAARFCIGLASLLLGMFVSGAIGWGIERVSRQTPFFMAVLIQATVLKCSFSVRSLATAAASVASALHGNDLPLARQRLAFHLVSRDVSKLDESSVAAAAIESVAENTSDSFIAPLIFFAVAGLPGALVYRYVNTCDAMLGYRTPDLEWIGKPAARMDDLLNLIPARWTAALMLLVGTACKCNNRREAIKVWWRDHRLTSSPNAGHPMSAAAGVLGVVLEKHDHYRLGYGQPLPTVASIIAVNSLLYRTVMAGTLVAIVWLIWVATLHSINWNTAGTFSGVLLLVVIGGWMQNRRLSSKHEG